MRPALTPDHAFVALGANLPGNSDSVQATLASAVVALTALSAEPVTVSSCYASDPKDCPPDSPPYINAVATLLPLPELDPASLLERLQQIEQLHGRSRSGLRNEARTLDLDLLTFAGISMQTPNLILPHPRAKERRFVLEPWAELAGPDWVLEGRTLGQWLQDCDDPPLQRLQGP